jgi:steroid delta-isomerase-like uncharacterized protein
LLLPGSTTPQPPPVTFELVGGGFGKPPQQKRRALGGREVTSERGTSDLDAYQPSLEAVMKLLAGTLLTAFGLCACSPRPQGTAGPDPKAVLQAYVVAWNRHDSLALDTLLAPAGVHEDLAQGFRGEGPAAVRVFMRDLIAVEPDYNWQLTSSFADGQSVAAEWTWTATYTGPGPTGPVTNQRITGRGVSIARIEKGKIAYFADYYDVASFFPKQLSTTTRN